MACASEVILHYEAGLDEIHLGGVRIRKVRELGNSLQIELDGDRDSIFLTGVSVMRPLDRKGGAALR